MKLSEFRADYARDRCDVERKALLDYQPYSFRAACAVLDELMGHRGFEAWWNAIDVSTQDETFAGIVRAIGETSTS